MSPLSSPARLRRADKSRWQVAHEPTLARLEPGNEKLAGEAHSRYPHDLRRLVDDYLVQLVFCREPGAEELERAIRYALLGGGKRVRPVLTLATARSLGLDERILLPTAAAIELIHTNSLIADDLPAMDGHMMRRGKQSLHVAFGEDVALLAGAALAAEAYRLILECQAASLDRVLLVAREITRASGAKGMVGGQYLDVSGAGRSVRRQHELKTGALIAAAVSCPLAIAGVGRSIADPYRRFGAELGVLFQIVDDIIDVRATTKKLGKRNGSDVRLGKRTYVSTYGLRQAERLARDSYEYAMWVLAEVNSSAPGETDALAAVANHIYASACPSSNGSRSRPRIWHGWERQAS